MFRVREEFDRQGQAPGPARRARFEVPLVETGDVVSWIIKSTRLIVLLALVGGVAGFSIVSIVPWRYAVETDLLIEPENLKVATNDLFPQRLQSDSQLLDVESKMRVITSGNVLQRVAAKLKLAEDPNFGRSWLSRFNLFEEPPSPDRSLGVLQDLSKRIKVSRQERSYMVAISVWGESPRMAVDIANALVESFETELNQTEAREATRIAASLQSRLSGLKDDAASADALVQDFRARHGLQKGSTGQLVNSQSMDSLNLKIADVRVQVTQAATRYRDAETALRRGTDTEVLKSPVITSLRIEQGTLDRKVASLSQTYGPAFPALAQARDEQRALQRAIKNEQKRLSEVAKTEVDRTKAVLSDLESQVAALKTTVSNDDNIQVQLRQLERTATAKAATYQAALTRADEVAERGRVDAVDVRVITDAARPLKRSWPPSRPILTAAGAALGILLGIAAAIAFGLYGSMRVRRNFGFA